MFARSALRVVARATPRTGRVAPALANKAFQASYVSNSKNDRADPLVPQSEVPLSSYADGAVERSTVTVGSSINETPIPEAEVVTPLTRAIYNSMPANLQKMTLMGKVVIVTG